MTQTQTQTEYDRNIRTAYVAMDALQALCDRGAGTDAIARTMEKVREVIEEIEARPIRRRGEPR